MKLEDKISENSTISSLRELLAQVEQENVLLEKAVAANNVLILYLFNRKNSYAGNRDKQA